ncbi:major facilitator superfamily protein [Hirsutella rhossiliensis]|uniref:Major facilitator superfamily domain-containing protein n=1 Tax=Hirsutella rhossiliensis TaxID=111463 RepID=A0A9P8N6Z1_9HYPO|nr:major facilitator superfamily domain-containing protein [Hirsutella rhossiliensis]KAH0967672.1 major facilitator superfamily domain-containing protein [Hirsutella rhossiliensis]
MNQHANASFNDGSSRPHPPGTLELFSKDNKQVGNDGKMVLMPTPSDDYNDPLTWSTFRKAWNYGLLTAMTMSIFAALAIQTVFWPQMLKEMDVTLQVLNNAQAAQLVGLAIGCVVFIPFAKKYGRRSTYIVSTILVTAAIWWSAFMKTSAEVIVTNILMGLAGATNETAVQMSIRDLFFVHQRGSANGVYLIAVTAGTFLTPMAAGAQAFSSGWRSSYLTLGGWMTGLSLLFILSFEETKFVPATQGMSTTGDAGDGDSASVRGFYELDPKLSRVDSEAPVRADAPPSRPPFPQYLRLQLVTRTNESLWKTFYYPIFSAWFPHVVFTFLEFASGAPYNFNPAQIGFMSAGPLIGSVLGSLYGGPLVDWAIVRFARRNRGIFEPEMRLWLIPLPALAMSAGLAIFGVTADRGMHFIFPSIGSAVFAYGFGGISDITFTLVIDSFPNLVAQTFVAIAFFRNAISIAGPFSITPWMEAMSVSSIFIIAAAISLGIHLIGVPLAIWGKKMRTSIAPRYYRLSEMSA